MNRFSFLVILVLCTFNSITILAQNKTPDTGEANCRANIPLAISPNGDGINDYLSVESNCEIDVFTLRIFDESNQLIFESNQISDSWDGSFKGNPLPEGHYSWSLSYKDGNSGHRIRQEGEIILVR